MGDTPEIGYAYLRVADDLARQIEAGVIPRGGKLGGELELGEVYGVAAGTVRRAVRELRARGLVVTLPGKGTYVTGPEAGGGQQDAPPSE